MMSTREHLVEAFLSGRAEFTSNARATKALGCDNGSAGCRRPRSPGARSGPIRLLHALTMPSRFPPMRWPSIQVGDQPAQFFPSVRIEAPSISCRMSYRLGATVMLMVFRQNFGRIIMQSAARNRAPPSILSTPLPKFGDHLSQSSVCRDLFVDEVRDGRQLRRTSAVRTAFMTCPGVIVVVEIEPGGLAHLRIRVSIESGRLARDDDERLFLTTPYLALMKPSPPTFSWSKASPFRPH